jgi:hypothetical protein
LLILASFKDNQKNPLDNFLQRKKDFVLKG